MILEIFWGFVAIAFAFAGAALIKFTRVEKPQVGKTINVEEALKIADAADYKINYLSRLYGIKFHEYLENTNNWLKDKASILKETLKYVMERQRQIASELYRKHIENQKYLEPLEQIRSRLEALLKKWEILYKIDKLKDAGYIGEKELENAGKEVIDLYKMKEEAARREGRLYQFLAKAGISKK